MRVHCASSPPASRHLGQAVLRLTHYGADLSLRPALRLTSAAAVPKRNLLCCVNCIYVNLRLRKFIVLQPIKEQASLRVYLPL